VPSPTPEPVDNATDSQQFVRGELLLAVVLPLALLAAVGLAGVFLREEVDAVAAWVFLRVGFAGLAALFFVSETIVSPLPPDAVLLLIASSELAPVWGVPVLALAVLSLLGGHVGWFLGGQLAQTGLVRRMLGRHHGRIVQVTRRYGMWAVVLAAATPLPWSVTSWTAGALHLPYRRYLLGALIRVPRIMVAYIFIHAAFHRAAPTFGL
jgi:membrane protein YqaA with SNARE-associated domain